ncbi:MAG: TM1802 family CRISPR-associated protein [Bacteroidales bacterium]|jgi:CRISPR-associated Csh1 family protein
MIEAIREIGILKMVDTFKEDFDATALTSVNSFLEQRKKAIARGSYGKLQFETINEDKVGIFVLDCNKISFEIEPIADIVDSWKYLFLKTASQGTYATPTWKEDLTKDKKGGVGKKITKTIEEFKRKSESTRVSWISDAVKIFTATDVEIGELTPDGKLQRKSFLDTILWAKSKSIRIFSVKINGKYCAEIPELLNEALLTKREAMYQTNMAQSTNLPEKCSLCNVETVLYPNVLSGVGLNIGNVDKPGFFPGIDSKNSTKAFPICEPCAEALYAAKFHVFPLLIQNISGHQTLIIPSIIETDDKSEGMEIITFALRMVKKSVSGAEPTEKNLLIDLVDNKSIANLTFIMGEVGGQSVQNIHKVIPSVLPSRLSEISRAIDNVNKIHSKYPDGHPWKSNKYKPLDGKLSIVRWVLGNPKYAEQKGGKGRKAFVASSVDTLDLLTAIFLKKPYSHRSLLTEFSAKLSYDFLGALSDENHYTPINVIQNNIANMMHLQLFLHEIEVIRINPGQNYVGKYLEQHEGLKPLNEFLSSEARGLDTREKQYAFLAGLLFGKLVRIQLARGVSTNALKWLKGLQISPDEVKEIFQKTRSKLDDYSTPKSAWSDEMRGVAEAVAALGASITNWEISRKEIPYYLCLGQSLSDYYLPSKSTGNAQKDKGGDKK